MSIEHIASKKYIRATPSGVAYADTSVLVTKEWSVNVYQGDKEDIQLGFDPQDQKQKTSNEHNVFDITFDVAGSGTPGTPIPGLSAFLQAAGGKETINAGQDVTYTKEPDQASIGAVDIEGRAKGVKTDIDYRYKTTNAKGSVGVSFSEKGYVEWKANKFTGDYSRPDEVATATLDYGTQKDNLALPANGETILVYQVGGRSLCVSAMDIPALWYGDAVRRSLPGGCVSTTLKDGILDGSFTMLEDDWTQFNIYEKLDTGAVIPFNVVMGTVPGLQCTISNPRIQILDAQPATIDDLSATQVSFRMLDPNVVKFH